MRLRANEGGRPRARGRRVLSALLALGLGLGCSGRKIAYRMAPTLAMSSIDQALKLRASQKERLRPRLSDLVAWHRREELPRYVALVGELRARLARGLGGGDVRWVRSEIEAATERAARQVAPIAGELLATLDASQIAALDRAVSEGSVRRRRKAGEGDEAARAEAKARVSAMEAWTGPLSPEQRAMVLAEVRRTQPDLVARRRRDTARLRAFVASLGPSRAPGSIALDVLRLAEPPREPDGPEARLVASTEAFAVALFATASPEQRRHLDRELASLESDLIELSKD